MHNGRMMLAGGLVTCILAVGLVGCGKDRAKGAVIKIDRPTVLFYTLAQAEFDRLVAEQGEDGGINQVMSDFNSNAYWVRGALMKHDIYQAVVTAPEVIIGGQARKTVFRKAEHGDLGYILVAPGKKPEIHDGVFMSEMLIQEMNKYFELGLNTEDYI